MKTLRIRNWSDHFENNRTRDLKRMDWVPIPNRMDKREYIQLVTHPNGAAHFGAWLALVEIASRCTTRGTLPWEGAEIPQALAEISRLPAGLFEEVLPRLLELNWIEEFREIPQVGAEIPQDDAPRVRARKGREGNSTEENGRESPSVRAALLWEEFWKIFEDAGKGLNDKDKENALKLWLNFEPPTHRRIIDWARVQIAERWTEERFTPMPAKVLRDEGWTRVALTKPEPAKPVITQKWRPYDPKTLENLDKPYGD